ncbi:MAG: aspartate aminotransferase family protein [Pseudomonadota bacterium]
MHAGSRSAILHRSFAATLPTVVRGEGPWLYDSEGRRYFDGSGGAAVSCLGHAHPKVVAAIEAQLRAVAFAHTSFFTNEPAEALAAHLIRRAPEGFADGAAMFLGSGSEAMEAALKLARQYWNERGASGRGRFIARDMAYHGNTLGALSVGGHMARRTPYAPMLLEVGRVPAAHPYRGQQAGEDDAAYLTRITDALEAEIQRLGPDQVAGFVVEPISGATLGCVPAPPGYFARIREICDRHEVLLIADEVMCGMGRTGTLFAMEQEGVAPDIITIAKGLGAGFQPIAAVLANGRVVEAIRAGSGALANGHTYMSHAVACAGALAVLETIEEEGLLARVAALGAHLRHGLEARFADHPNVGDIRGRGLFQAVEFVADRASKRPLPASAQFAARLKTTAREMGLIAYPASGCADGVAGDHLLLAPPFIATETELDAALDIAAAAVDHCLDATAAVA